ncbi:MAG: hypothetical protein P1P74_10830 [Desulfuromonadales bacterium]|nr:hypothetical protein [Desulfuromonadales bacterium]
MIDKDKITKIQYVGSGLFVLMLALTWLSRPIYDPDFFWHLKTGEWIWQHRALPVPDPFSFTTSPELGWPRIFTLNGYWLGQIIYHGLYALCDWWGIFALRFALVTSLAAIFYFFRQGGRLVWSCCAALTILLLVESYPVERPQFFSFVFFAGLYLYLDRLFSKGQSPQGKQAVIGVTLLMLVWANIHGGVILGQGLLLLVMIFACWRRFPGGSRVPPLKNPLRLWLIALAGLAATVFNPNGLKLFIVLFEIAGKDRLFVAANEEYASLFQLWQEHTEPAFYLYVLVILLTLNGLVRNLGTTHPFRIFVICGTLIQAVISLRYMPFFLCAALPAVASGLTGVTVAPHLARVAMPVIVLCTLLVFGRNEMSNLQLIRQEGFVSTEHFPVALTTRIKPLALSGRLYAPDEWGGYLMWQLGPAMQLMWDGRMLDEGVIRDALAAEMTGMVINGRPIWQSVFEKYRIDCALLPMRDENGPNRLAMALYRAPTWSPLAADRQAVLFTRK